MDIAFIKYAMLHSTIVMVSICGINGRFLTSDVGVQESLDLLENNTDVSAASNTMSIIASTFNRSADTQTRIKDPVKDTLERVANTHTQVANAQVQMANAQRQIANTQTEMADVLTQAVNLLQKQTQQLQNMTDAMTAVVAQLDTQNRLLSLQPTGIPRDCSDLVSRGFHTSGSYTIQPGDNLGNIRVYCDMDTANGEWTVFQRRFDGSLDFFLDWNAYEEGFGSRDGEHWMGLRQLHRLTRQGSWTLRVDLEDFGGNTAYAEYDSFSIGDSASFYRLSIGAYSGTAGDSLRLHNNHHFSTKDSDHDSYGGHCAQSRRGAWWYYACTASNLNGLYLGESRHSNKGMVWGRWKRSHEVLKRAEMKIRRVR